MSYNSGNDLNKPLAVHIAALEGRRVHAALFEKFKKEDWEIENTQLCPLTTFGKVWGLLLGTPDMFQFKEGLLRVIDIKTVTNEASTKARET